MKGTKTNEGSEKVDLDRHSPLAGGSQTASPVVGLNGRHKKLYGGGFTWQGTCMELVVLMLAGLFLSALVVWAVWFAYGNLA